MGVFRDAVTSSLINSWVGPLILRGAQPSDFKDPVLGELVFRIGEMIGLVEWVGDRYVPVNGVPQIKAPPHLVKPLQTIWNRWVYPALVRGERKLSSDVEQAIHRLYRALQPVRLSILSELDLRGRLVLVAGYHPCGMAIDVINVGADLILVEDVEDVTRIELALIDSFVPQAISIPGPEPAPGAYYIYANAPLTAIRDLARVYGPSMVVVCHQPREIGDDVEVPIENIVFEGVVGAVLDLISYLLGLGSGARLVGRVRRVNAG